MMWIDSQKMMYSIGLFWLLIKISIGIGSRIKATILLTNFGMVVIAMFQLSTKHSYTKSKNG
jgi:hypothetical protein